MTRHDLQAAESHLLDARDGACEISTSRERALTNTAPADAAANRDNVDVHAQLQMTK